ncbi:MAG: hypothetical protein ACOZQL_12995 [Myxococcota bacterium]
MLLTLVMLITTSAGGAKVALVERTSLGVKAAEAARLRAQLATTLGAEGLDVEQVGPACTERACLLELARARGGCVVGVTLVKNRKGLTVDLEAVAEGQVILQQTFLLTGTPLDRSPEAQVFAHQLATRTAKDDRPLEERAREEPRLTPRETVVEEELPAVTAAAPAAPKVLGISASAVGAVAIGLLVASAVVKGNLDAALAEKPVITTLSRAQAQQQADVANGLLAGGVLGLGLGLAGGATAFVLGLGPPPDGGYR